MQNVMVRFVMIRLLEIRPYNLLVCTCVPTKRILLKMIRSSALCIWWHFIIVPLGWYSRKVQFRHSNLHKVIKLISNKELWVWKKKVHVSGTEEESVRAFLVECRWEILGGLCGHSNRTSHFASIHTAQKSLTWGSHIESKCFRKQSSLLYSDQWDSFTSL